MKKVYKVGELNWHSKQADTENDGYNFFVALLVTVIGPSQSGGYTHVQVQTKIVVE